MQLRQRHTVISFSLHAERDGMGSIGALPFRKQRKAPSSTGANNEHWHYWVRRPRFQRGPTAGKERDFGDDRQQPRSGIARGTRRRAWPFDQGWHRQGG